MAELESHCEALGESQRNSLTEQLNRMAAENLQLRDTNDELSAEVESLRGQLAVAVRFNISLFLFVSFNIWQLPSLALQKRLNSNEHRCAEAVYTIVIRLRSACVCESIKAGVMKFLS